MTWAIAATGDSLARAYALAHGTSTEPGKDLPPSQNDRRGLLGLLVAQSGRGSGLSQSLDTGLGEAVRWITTAPSYRRALDPRYLAGIFASFEVHDQLDSVVLLA